MKAQLTIAGLILIMTAELFSSILLYTQANVLDVQAKAIVRGTPKQTLPQKCAPYYNDGTDNWKACMGVDYK